MPRLPSLERQIVVIAEDVCWTFRLRFEKRDVLGLRLEEGRLVGEREEGGLM